MESSPTFCKMVREKGLACTVFYAAMGAGLLVREKAQALFDQLVTKDETSDDPCARAVRRWLEKKERG